MSKDISIKDLVNNNKIIESNFIIDIGVGMENKGDFLYTVKNFPNTVIKFREVNINKDKLKDFKSPRDLQDKIKGILNKNKVDISSKMCLLSNWIFLEWIEVNPYGYETNVRKFLCVQRG
ncbi:MAG: hypothetical protein WC942_08110 [Clostridia bacterium]|jgi:hypothetical protein